MPAQEESSIFSTQTLFQAVWRPLDECRQRVKHNSPKPPCQKHTYCPPAVPRPAQSSACSPALTPSVSECLTPRGFLVPEGR